MKETKQYYKKLFAWVKIAKNEKALNALRGYSLHHIKTVSMNPRLKKEAMQYHKKLNNLIEKRKKSLN